MPHSQPTTTDYITNATDERDALAYVVAVLIGYPTDERDAMRARVIAPYIALENDHRDEIQLLAEIAQTILRDDQRASVARTNA